MSEEKPFKYDEPWQDDGAGEIEGSGYQPLVAFASLDEPEIEWASKDHQARAISCVNALAGYPQEKLAELPVGGVTALIAGMADYLDFAVSVGQHHRSCLSRRHADAQPCNCWLSEVRTLLEKAK